MMTMEEIRKDKVKVEDKINKILLEFLDKYGDLNIDVDIYLTKHYNLGGENEFTYSIFTNINIHI